MNKFNLVIVDLQYDFADSCGSMYVNGACDLPDKIGKFIERNRDNIDRVIFTVDWHIPKHPSFTEQGGPWPPHCIEHSRGASISQDLINKINSLGLVMDFIEKGYLEEEYGAFENIQYKWNKYLYMDSYYYVLSNKYYDSSISIYSPDKKLDFVVCGLCGDYCVMETMKNLMKEPNFTVKAYNDGILSIDGGEKFENFVKENNIEIVE